MCRSTLNVGYQGELFDCDFNQMLGPPHGWKNHLSLGSGSEQLPRLLVHRALSTTRTGATLYQLALPRLHLGTLWVHLPASRREGAVTWFSVLSIWRSPAQTRLLNPAPDGCRFPPDNLRCSQPASYRVDEQSRPKALPERCMWGGKASDHHCTGPWVADALPRPPPLKDHATRLTGQVLH